MSSNRLNPFFDALYPELSFWKRFPLSLLVPADCVPGFRERVRLYQLAKGVEGRVLRIVMKRGRITGRQAQMMPAAGSAVDQMAKVRRPVVKRLGEERAMARAIETATVLR